MSSNPVGSSQSQEIQDEIAELQERLEKAKARLNQLQGPSKTPPAKDPSIDGT
jgi:urease accessory protein